MEGVDELSRRALSRARKQADAIVIDEIAPMEVKSDVFIEQARACLDGRAPVLGAIHQASERGFIGEVKNRADVDVLVVDERNREAVPSVIVDRVLETLEG